VRDVKSEDRDAAFSAFTVAHRRDLLRAATLLCAGDAATAEDIVQATLTKLYVSWSRLLRADNPVAYARAALTNTFLSEMQRAHRRRETTQVNPDRLLELTSSTDNDQDTRPLVLAALATLAPRQRAVVVLRHWCDLDTSSTAEVLGCSVGTVKSQNAKALAHLRSILGDRQLLEVKP
jgi:RNA polymerase sigma-70 factor (sigma-E family)